MLPLKEDMFEAVVAVGGFLPSYSLGLFPVQETP